MRTRSSAPHCGNPSNSTGARAGGPPCSPLGASSPPAGAAACSCRSRCARPPPRTRRRPAPGPGRAAPRARRSACPACAASRPAAASVPARPAPPGVRAALGPVRAGPSRCRSNSNSLGLMNMTAASRYPILPAPGRAASAGRLQLALVVGLDEAGEGFLGHGQELARAVGRRDVLHIGPGQIGRAHRHQVLVGGRGLFSASASVSLSPDASAKLPLTKE